MRLSGSSMECIYALVAYGIPKSSLPFDTSGAVIQADYRSWLSRRQMIEGGTSATFVQDASGTIQPTEADVLMGGNGKEISLHPGNVAFRELLEVFSEEYYSTTSRKTKGSVCQRIIKSVKDGGGRFLTREKGLVWKEIEDEASHVKIAHAFRNRKRPKKESR